MLRPMPDTQTDDDRLRYPVGRYQTPATLSPAQREAFIREIAEAPAALRTAVAGLSNAQLDTPYRPGGWTVRQVAHHVPDSHLNAYVRLKLALTEDNPTVKPYDEQRWAELADVRSARIETSLALLEALHERWVLVLRSMGPAEWERRLLHPERGVMTLDDLLASYAWHGRHHVAHVTSLRARLGW
jgi:DinB superfamily